MIKKIFNIVFILLILKIFLVWFLPGTITGGDLWYFFPSMYSNHSLFPSEWLFFANNGLGGTSVLFQAVNFVMAIPLLFGKIFNLSWEVLVRIFILYPFLIITPLSIIYFLKKIFPENNLYVFSAILFTLNSYILMLISGGLVIIGIGYGLIPLVFYLLIKLTENFIATKPFIKYTLLMGIVLGIQSLLDVRISYMVFYAAVIYLFIFSLRKNIRTILGLFFFGLVIPFLIDGLINAFWVIPAIFSGYSSFNELGSAYTSLDSVRFFSFSTFENSISLLHPNWPENIFGKIYFQKAEFLLLPILAFSSLLFIKKQEKDYKKIIFLVLLSLFSIFLAKGSNDPFGQIYLWLFKYVPGFILFRDPTKWYMLTAFAFSILIPFVLFNLSKKFNKLNLVIPFVFLVYCLYLIYPAILGKIPGTLQESSVPNEYILFEKFMHEIDGFSRVMWIPHGSRFTYYSSDHPLVAADDYFKTGDSRKILKNLANYNQIKKLKTNSVKYLVVPFDSRGEIFIKDRKYDKKSYIYVVNELKRNTYLKELRNFGEIIVFEIKNYNGSLIKNSNISILNTKFIGSIISLLTGVSLFLFIIYIKKNEN